MSTHRRHKTASLRKYTVLIASAVLVFTSWGIATGQLFALDPDPFAVLSTPRSSVNSWWQDGHPTKNGFVRPPDSVAFDGSTTADFYRWAYHMFLYVNSPTQYPNHPIVLQSPQFYALSPENADGTRELIPQDGSHALQMEVRVNKPRLKPLTTLADDTGKPHLLVNPKTSAAGRMVVLTGTGKEVEVASIRRAATGGKIEFLDSSGKPVQGARLQPTPTPDMLGDKGLAGGAVAPSLGFIVKLDGNQILTDAKGKQIPSRVAETAQVDSNVQMTQPYQTPQGMRRSLIYYTISVNDFWATFMTRVKKTNSYWYLPSESSPMPADSVTMKGVADYATAHKHTIAHPSSLCIEVKSAWVDADAVAPNQGQYITIEATVPKYDQSNPKHWVLNGTELKRLALVGMHVVGSVRGHPEMVWATFEHEGNAPNSPYSYINRKQQIVKHTTAMDGKLRYLFNQGFVNTGDIPHAKIDSKGDIVAVGDSDIQGTNAMRRCVFGSVEGLQSDQADTYYASNTILTNLYEDYLVHMPQTDPRYRYFLVGAEWTSNGTGPGFMWWTLNNDHIGPPLAPNSNNSLLDKQFREQFPFPYANIMGTPFVANSTMETFEQCPNAQSAVQMIPWSNETGPNAPVASRSPRPNYGCFSCHQGISASALSHVFSITKPLY